MSYLDRIAECNRHDLTRYRSLAVAGRPIGRVRNDRAADLVRRLPRFERNGAGIELRGGDRESRSSLFEALAFELAAAGEIRPPSGELYPAATAFGGDPLFLLDRSAVAYFGIPAYGVHLNGFVRRGDGIHMWIGERSATKQTYPGMLDNLVAGGQPHGIGLFENLLKECREEAGIPAELAARSVAVGAVAYCAEHDSGLKPDTMFCYDLELPADFEPRNTDGEVAGFRLLPLAEVAAIVRDTTRFKFNCNLVIIGFLVRHGFLDPGGGDYLEIVRGLCSPAGRS